MSASAIAAVTVIDETSAIVTKPELEVVEVVLAAEPVDAAPDAADPVELEEDELLLLPEVEPTEPLTAVTSPVMGAVRVAAAMFAWSLVTVWVSVVTWSWAVYTCDCALEIELADGVEVVVWPFIPVVVVGVFAEASAELARTSCALAWVSWVSSLLSVWVRSVVSRVPSTWPAVTVWPSPTLTVAIVPETAKEGETSLTGAIDPLAVMVVLTVPCCTVEVSWVAVLAEDLMGLRKK
jgi:hypothetical protein